MTAPSIVWFRRDLRLADQAALRAACAAGPVICVYVLDDETARHRAMGGASRWWLHHSLASLDRDLRERGARLILRRGVAVDVLAALAQEVGAGAVHALHHYEPWWRNAEKALAKALAGQGRALVLHDGNYLAPPGTARTGSGGLFKIYTPFWRALTASLPPMEPSTAPAKIVSPKDVPPSDVLDDWNLLPIKPNWAKCFAPEWTVGEAGALDALESFAPMASGYDSGRNLPSKDQVSRLSPHLHFGEISPATIWHGLPDGGASGATETFRKELGWRDYAQNLVVQFPDYGRTNGRAAFDAFPWRSLDDADVAEDFHRWCHGQTGYPIVDAGMRQLWATGWMHNRVRMITASFLIKHLLIDWRHGEAWFWDTLVDADYASNATNWQWTAGSGVDANMFVRIMAPLTQSEKFDAADYIRRWVPELAGLSQPAIHDPDEFGQRPRSYPAKIIGHRAARERALAAHSIIKGG